jgi:OOP family OmpA-OmpF porin
MGLTLAALLASGSVRADPLPSVDLRGFQPPTAPDGSLYLEPTRTPGPWQWNTAGWLSWSYRPVVLRDMNGDRIASIVDHQMSFDFTASTGIGRLGAIGVDLPAVVYQTGDSTTRTAGVLGESSLPAQALGDLAVTGKACLLPYGDMGGFGLAALARVGVPTGDRTSFLGEGSLTSELRLSAELRMIAVAAQGTAGFKLRTEQRTFAGKTWGNEIPWGLGLSVFPKAFGIDPAAHWTWTLETHGALPAGPSAPLTDASLSPAVVGASARYAMGDVSLLLGVEGPLDGAVGVPLVRAIGAVAWAPRAHDMDNDGVPDDVDECPELAEDRDGHEDHDGCPDFDDDDDGVPDKQDRCPGQQEDLDEFEDDDGCPDPDNDRDGVPDEADACPLVWGPAGANPDPARNGCPVMDKDGDGIDDSKDRCPGEPEDKDGYQDDDGCPDLDNDADDVPDAQDACPGQPGPASSNPKWNGCPIPDADGDTFDDASDKCPSEPETWNGVKDDDGCADEGGRPLVTVRATAVGPALILARPIEFKGADSAPEVDPRSIPTVRAIASELNRHPSWVVAIGVRPNPRHGPLAETQALSRSFAVVLALRTFTFRDGVAETVGWSAVRDQPGASTSGVGILVLGDAAPQEGTTAPGPNPASPTPPPTPAPATP